MDFCKCFRPYNISRTIVGDYQVIKVDKGVFGKQKLLSEFQERIFREFVLGFGKAQIFFSDGYVDKKEGVLNIGDDVILISKETDISSIYGELYAGGWVACSYSGKGAINLPNDVDIFDPVQFVSWLSKNNVKAAIVSYFDNCPWWVFCLDVEVEEGFLNSVF